MVEHQGLLNERPFQFIICFLQVNFGCQESSFPSLVVNKVKKFLRKDIVVRCSSTWDKPRMGWMNHGRKKRFKPID